MARYSPQEQDNMRREASRRAREMQQRAPILPGGMRQEPMGDMLPPSAAPKPPVKPPAGTHVDFGDDGDDLQRWRK